MERGGELKDKDSGNKEQSSVSLTFDGKA